jgi:hypothetical protein
LASTAVDGSRAGTGGTSTSPAPSPPREDLRPLEERLPRRLPEEPDPETVAPALTYPLTCPERDPPDGPEGTEADEGAAGGHPAAAVAAPLAA